MVPHPGAVDGEKSVARCAELGDRVLGVLRDDPVDLRRAAGQRRYGGRDGKGGLALLWRLGAHPELDPSRWIAKRGNDLLEVTRWPPAAHTERAAAGCGKRLQPALVVLRRANRRLALPAAWVADDERPIITERMAMNRA